MAIERIKIAPVTLDDDGSGALTFDFGTRVQGRNAIITRMIAAIVLSGETTLATDTFTRVTTGGWGIADTGQPWTILSSAAPADFSTTGTEGRITVSNVAIDAIHLPLSVIDASILFTMNRAPQIASPADQRAIARSVGAADYVFARLTGTVSPFTISLNKRVAGVETTLLSTTKAFAFPAKVRFTVEGTVLSGKWWTATDPEPANVDLAATGPTIPAPVAGGLGVARNIAAGEGIGQQYNYDNLDITGIAPISPTWDAYINDSADPTNLVDSSQGIAFPRWVPALVNGQPIFPGDTLTIVATNGTPGSRIFASCHLVLEDIPGRT